MADLQDDIEIDGTNITGTVKYIADYSAAGYTGDEVSGNFLALHFDSDVDDVVLKAKLINGVHDEVTLDADRICIFRIADKDEQKIRITAEKDGESYSKIYDLTGLTLEES